METKLTYADPDPHGVKILSQETTSPAIFSEGDEHPASSNTAIAMATRLIGNPYLSLLTTLPSLYPSRQCQR